MSFRYWIWDLSLCFLHSWWELIKFDQKKYHFIPVNVNILLMSSAHLTNKRQSAGSTAHDRIAVCLLDMQMMAEKQCQSLSRSLVLNLWSLPVSSSWVIVQTRWWTFHSSYVETNYRWTSPPQSCQYPSPSPDKC